MQIQFKFWFKWDHHYYNLKLERTSPFCQAGIKGEGLYNKAKTILLEMGTFFQIQVYMHCTLHFLMDIDYDTPNNVSPSA